MSFCRSVIFINFADDKREGKRSGRGVEEQTTEESNRGGQGDITQEYSEVVLKLALTLCNPLELLGTRARIGGSGKGGGEGNTYSDLVLKIT